MRKKRETTSGSEDRQSKKAERILDHPTSPEPKYKKKKRKKTPLFNGFLVMSHQLACIQPDSKVWETNFEK
jgi:hypothetical protein